jgi:8-oxo-dGTP pyrophosphatase MutT (NUDIX family)
MRGGGIMMGLVINGDGERVASLPAAGLTTALIFAVLTLCGPAAHAAEPPKCSKDHDAAGVLPYTIRDGEVWVLLGHEPGRPYWTDFVGGREMEDCTPQETAAREFAEESRLAYPIWETLPMILDSNAVIVGGGRVHIWVLEVDWLSETEIASYPELDESEKDTYCWMPLKPVLDAVDSGDEQSTGVPDDCPGEQRAFLNIFRNNLLRGNEMRKHLDWLLAKYRR